MKFQKFAKILQTIEETSSRNDMTDLIVDMLKSLSKEEVNEAMYLMQGRVVPRFIPLEFSVARKLMIRSLAKAFGSRVEMIEKEFKQLGDLGLVGEKLCKRKDSTLQILDVYKQLYDIASLGGTGSQKGKINGIAGLIKSCDKLSCRYVVRMILGNLRLGVSDKSVLDALSIYLVKDKSYRETLDKAYGARSDIGFIAESVITKGKKIIEDIKIEVGTPVASMNCEREQSLAKILERMEDKVIVQPKYDGLRCQVHYSKRGFSEELTRNKGQKKLLKQEKNLVRIFSRNLEDLTEMFPDVKTNIQKLNIDSIVIDSEAVGYDKEHGRYIPFQETIQRKRKYDIKEKIKSVPIRLFTFDILYLNGKDLSEVKLEERLEILKKVLKGNDSIVEFTPSDLVTNEKHFSNIFEKYVADGLEGIIAKDPISAYYPGKRGFDWIKFKKSATGHLIDDVDTVALGYYSGRGVRAKFGIGAILVGVLNKKEGKFESIAKVGTGIKDSEWKDIKKRLDDIAVEEKPQNVDVVKELTPSVWVKPEVIMVVSADEITKSPSHKAGFSKGKGYSLRFPRMKLFDREDKTSWDATTVREIKDMFKLQFEEK